MLNEFRLLEEIPEQHKSVWVWGMSEILRRLEEDPDCALMWFCFLPQALLRKGNRGGKAGRGQVARRFNTLGKGDWGGLVEMWEKDKQRQKKKREGRGLAREKTDAEQLEKRKREVLALIASGKISKAMQRVTSHGVAAVSDPAVLAQLKAKYPSRGMPLPERVTRGQAVDSLRGLREALLGLEPGISPGTGGLRAEYLIVLAERMEDEDMSRLENFGMKYLSGGLEDWFYPVWLTVQTVPLYKTEETNTVRPVGVRNPLLNKLHAQVIIQNKEDLRIHFEPQQIACSEAGAAKLVITIRTLLEMKREFVTLKLDLQNAFNECSRSSIISALESAPALRHLAWFAAITLASYSGLESGGEKWGESGEGTTQGGPESSPWFCAAIHTAVRRLDEALKAAGGLARFGMDDGYAVGPKEIVFSSIREFEKEVKDVCGLELEWSKTEVFSWDGRLPEGCPEGITLAGEGLVGGVFQPGVLCYGQPVGSPEYVTSQLWMRARKIVADAKKTVEVLGGEKQAIWAALKWSISTRFDYWLQLSYPTDIQPVAAWLDGELWTVLEAAVGRHIPRGQEGKGWETVLSVPVVGREGHSFASWVVRLPVNQGGMGLRSLEETSLVAFLGAVEQVVPSFANQEAGCHQVTPFLGGLESFGEAAAISGVGRWEHMLEHGGRMGEEVRRAWGQLRLEAAQSSSWLDEEIEGSMKSPVQNFGEGGTAIRRTIVEEREQQRARIINKAVKEYHDQEARPTWAWLDRGKQSSSWLLTITGLTGPEFAEAASSLLCLPSPACAARIGETVKGRTKIDIYGDTVRAANLTGDGFRRRHDNCKDFLLKQLRVSGLTADCEVFNLFSREIPQTGLARIERGRTRQSIVPDFRISIPEEGGRVIPTLYEMKVISSCKTRYKRNPKPEARAVDARSDLLPGEYLTKARNTDRKFGGTLEGEIGGVERKLLSFPRVKGLVIGAFGELNEDFRELLQKMAQSKLSQLEHQPGGRVGSKKYSEKQRLATITTQIRQQLSRVSVQNQARLLLDRLEGLGGGAGMAARRRAQVRFTARRMERERQAQLVAARQGRRAYRFGAFRMDS